MWWPDRGSSGSARSANGERHGPPRLDPANVTASEIAAGLANPHRNPFVVEGPVPIQHRTVFTFNAGSGESEGEEPPPGGNLPDADPCSRGIEPGWRAHGGRGRRRSRR